MLSGGKSCRKPPPVARKKSRNAGGGTGPGEKEPLKLVDAGDPKQGCLLFQFDAFRSHLEIERAGERDGGQHQAMDARSETMSSIIARSSLSLSKGMLRRYPMLE